MLTKQSLRQALKRQRAALSDTALATAGERCLTQLLNLPLFSNAQTVGVYLDFRGEMRTDAIIGHLLQRHQHVFLPLIRGESLVFARHKSADDLCKNRYGILEPTASATRCDASTLDLLLMPLVAFDRSGNRLGMGGGYYDKTLGSMQNKPLLIGLAHAFQEVSLLNSEPWDVPLNGIATEQELILV